MSCCWLIKEGQKRREGGGSYYTEFLLNASNSMSGEELVEFSKGHSNLVFEKIEVQAKYGG